MKLRLGTQTDAEALRTIYNREVSESTSTFDIEPRTLAEQRDWIAEREGALGVVVAEIEGRVSIRTSPHISVPSRTRLPWLNVAEMCPWRTGMPLTSWDSRICHKFGVTWEARAGPIWAGLTDSACRNCETNRVTTSDTSFESTP